MNTSQEYYQTESNIVQVLRSIYDPEIPVNIYDLGLIYEIDIEDGGLVKLVMTLTAPNCPMADELLQEVNDRVREVDGVNELDLKLVFDPPWDKDMMTEEAKLDLRLL